MVAKPVRKSTGRQLFILAPAYAELPEHFTNVTYQEELHRAMLSEMRRLRGRIYFEDGAIGREQMTPDGRHVQAADERSWHVLSVENGRVVGCARYMEHSTNAGFAQLGVSSAAISHCDTWGWRFKASVAAEMRRARNTSLPYVEVGGWALDHSARHSCEALRLALSTYAVSQMLGGCVGASTVTVRNNSSSILRRIGGRSFVHGTSEIPSYFDPQYGCEMEVLRFDSWEPNEKYAGWIDSLKNEMANAPVVCAAARERQRSVVPNLLPVPGISSGYPMVLPSIA